MSKNYQSPLSSRYASSEMNFLFSDQNKHRTWRKLWLTLAQAQKDLGLAISQKQIDELKMHIDDIDFEQAKKHESVLHHDVMAHIYTYAEKCPTAKSIIHLGATSCLITDNADVIIMRDALFLIQKMLITLIQNLALLAKKYKDLPCLSYTHFQAAQPCTVGKRISLWLQDFFIDAQEMEHCLENLRLLGIKGATGTQASFLKLFDGNHEKVKMLEEMICQGLHFKSPFPVSGQTYSRKQDVKILNVLSAIATSAHKISTDLRLLAHLKEIEEPFSEKQIGSSAMPYKRNPMQNERICALARFVISLSANPSYTAATQWFERSLDDSANRRLCLPEAFLTTDSILQLLIRISKDLNVYPKVIEKNLEKEIPFLATEHFLMASVKKGSDRQAIHESIRKHSMASSKRIKEEGLDNDLLSRISQDPTIPLSEKEIKELLKNSNFIGRSPEQVTEFLDDEINPFLEKHQDCNIENELQPQHS